MYVLCGRSYEGGSTVSMAEEGSVYDSEGLEEQLQSLLCRYTNEELRADSKPFCSDFCKLVEEYATHWQVPLPQIRILEKALCYFARASTFFTSSCDHVLHTLSSLALSVFELLLFFDQKDLQQEPLKQFTVTFQECHLALARHQNVHLLQVERLVRGGGPWACPALQAILSGSSIPQREVDGYISSELPVFFELRVRYLLTCEQVTEAMALAKSCAWHPTAGQHLFFLQFYLTWLFKTSQHERLRKEVADFSGKDAIHIICSLEYDENDELLLALSRAFLSKQLCRGDMYYLCDLIFVWSKLHHRLKTSKQALLEEVHQLMLSSTNVASLFPFIRVILLEVGENGIQFCVELCANALKSSVPCDIITKSLIYKTIAGLLPNDLEVCRACALLVFFLERTVEAYKIVYVLYLHPDQEYHVEYSPIRNHVRFETLQILKKDLYFDPEFWNLIALRTNCLKLMSDKVVSSALEEIMEDKWILNYCAKEPALRSSLLAYQKGTKWEPPLVTAKKRQHKEEGRNKTNSETASKRLKLGRDKSVLNADRSVKRKGNQGSLPIKDGLCQPLRRSFWQLDRLQGNGLYGESRRTTRLSEKNPPKRRIRTPRWLLEDSGTVEENNVPQKIRKHGLKNQKHHQSSLDKRYEASYIKNNAKHKTSANSHLMVNETKSKNHKGFSLDCQLATPPQVILELSLPDNELMGSFNEDSCNRQRGFPQVLFYKPTVKFPVTSQPLKTLHGKEVIIRARDPTMFVQQLHCYARRQKGKGNGSNNQGSVSTITRSSMQGSPLKGPQRELFSVTDMNSGFMSQPPAEFKESVSENVDTAKPGSRKSSSVGELSEKSSVEMEGTVASQESAKATELQELDKVPQVQSTGKVLQTKEIELTIKSELNVTKVSQNSGDYVVTENLKLDKVLHVQTRPVSDESAVEMKVTIASQTTTPGIVTQSLHLDEVPKAPSLKGDSKIAIFAEVLPTANIKSQTMVIEEKNLVSDMASNSTVGVRAADPTTAKSQEAVLGDGIELDSNVLAYQAVTRSPEVITNSLSEVDISSQLSEGYIFSENSTKPGTATISTCIPTGPDSINGTSALIFVTEMVNETAPSKQAHKQLVPKDSASEGFRAERKPEVFSKLKSTSSCSVSELENSDQQTLKEGAYYITSETPDNSEPIESEESKLEYCCTFCNKDFKGSRVVAHAMFHYRKDECMFCGTMFKDDLLAMMHLSDHIEKLKKIKESAGNKAQDNCICETKDISSPKTSAKAKTTNMSYGSHSSERRGKSAVCPKSGSHPDSVPSRSRKLRSNDKQLICPPLQEKQKENLSKHLKRKISVLNVNGHMGRKKVLDRRKKEKLNTEAKQPFTQQKHSQKGTSEGARNVRLQENKDVDMDPTTSVQINKGLSCFSDDQTKVSESSDILKTTTKQGKTVVEENNMKPQKKVSCPVDGCAWFKDLSKNRVALLYHALDDHHGEVSPLKLAFRIGNNRCSICMRVLRSFEHFQHHVERHRQSPRHPCLHQGCTSRFKTGMEMRRHTRRHSPLQAACCLPGCSQLFICLWALNLHEREHYGLKTTKPDKNTNKKTGVKHIIDMPAEGKQPDHKAKDETATTAGNKTLGSKATLKLRGRPRHSSSITIRVSPFTRNKDSYVLKSLSNRDTSPQLTGPTLRLRETLTKANTSLVMLQSHKVISRNKIKLKHKFKEKQVNVNTKGPKRRGRPPKSKKVVLDEYTATSQNTETVKIKMDQIRLAEPANPTKAAETLNVSKRVEDQGKSLLSPVVVKTTDLLTSESKSEKLKNKKLVSNPAETPTVTANSLNQSITTSLAEKSQKLTTLKMKTWHKANKRSASKENGHHTASASGSSKKRKQEVLNHQANARTEPDSVSEKLAKPNSVCLHIDAKSISAPTLGNDDEGITKGENTDLTQASPVNYVLAVPAKSVREITLPYATSGENSQNVITEEESKKPHVTKKVKKGNNTQITSESAKTKNKRKDAIKIGDKRTVKERRRSKDSSKIFGLKKEVKLKPERQQAKPKAEAIESSPGVEGKANEETPKPDSNFNKITSKSTVTAENKQKTTKKKKSIESPVLKNSDPNKTKKKRKAFDKEGNTNTVKKKCKDQSAEKPVNSETEAQPVTEVKVEVAESSVGSDGKISAETPQSKLKGRGYSRRINGQAAAEDLTSTVCKDTLASYGKKPYLRPPPTAYLDEKFTTMPKRRKEMTFLQWSQRREQEKVTATQLRQRCANCFATFSSVEELQSHLQLQKCSNLFGFDSDDELATVDMLETE